MALPALKQLPVAGCTLCAQVQGSVPAVAEIEVRAAVLADLPQIAAVALATGQSEEWGGADPAYMMHLLAVGRVVVGAVGGSVVGFGAT